MGFNGYPIVYLYRFAGLQGDQIIFIGKIRLVCQGRTLSASFSPFIYEDRVTSAMKNDHIYLAYSLVSALLVLPLLLS
jgi:hypothetical protein